MPIFYVLSLCDMKEDSIYIFEQRRGNEHNISKRLNYTEYVSHTYDSKKVAMNNKSITTLRCNKCNRKLQKKIRWFVNNTNTQYPSYAKDHNSFSSYCQRRFFYVKR